MIVLEMDLRLIKLIIVGAGLGKCSRSKGDGNSRLEYVVD